MSEQLLENAHTLYRAEKFDEAAHLYHEVLRGNPRHFEALYSLGTLYFRRGRFEQAEYLIAEALKRDPFFVEGLCMRGLAQLKLKRYDKAIAAFDSAIALKPDFVDAISNRATALLEMGRHEEAIAGFDSALAIDPRHAVSWNNRGNALHALSRNEEALESYDRALAIDPEFPDARQNRLFALGALKRGSPEFADVLYAQGMEAARREQWTNAELRFFEALAADPEHAGARMERRRAAIEANRRLFDEFAPKFDEQLHALKYDAPADLRRLAGEAMPDARAPLRILDIGCGTGLSGLAFGDLAQDGALVGVDISPNMIERARNRGIYSELILGDLEMVLSQPGEPYDLIICADVLVYFGELGSVFSGAFQNLRSGGLFLFAVEGKDGEGWDRSMTTLRYRHSESYLRTEAARAGFTLASMAKPTLRLEHSVPVPGLAVALRKPD